MLYRDFGRMSWKVSAIGQGCWNIGNQWGEMSDSQAESIIHSAIEKGINLFDVAESYGIPTGLSEIRLGKAIQGKRDKVYIVSKIGHWGARTGQAVPKTTSDMIRLCGHASAGRLKTDWIDVMLCHDANIADPSIYIEGFEELKKEGFIREYGISTDRIDVLRNFYEKSDGRCAVVEIDYSLINRKPEEELLPYCMEKGIAVLVRGPVAKGLLSGKYDSNTIFKDEVRKGWNKNQSGREEFESLLGKVDAIKAALPSSTDLVTTALRYVISHPSAPVVIPGATDTNQVMSNAKAGERLLTEEEMKSII